MNDTSRAVSRKSILEIRVTMRIRCMRIRCMRIRWHAGRDSRAAFGCEERPAELAHNPRPSGSKNHPRLRNNARLRSSHRRELHWTAHSGAQHGPTAVYGLSSERVLPGPQPHDGQAANVLAQSVRTVRRIEPEAGRCAVSTRSESRSVRDPRPDSWFPSDP